MFNQIHNNTKATAPCTEGGFHPLANDFVSAVFPFWVRDRIGDAILPGDINDTDTLFEKDVEIAEDALLHLQSSKIIANHGETVAEILAGCTGLYVLVDDIDATADNISGEILSFNLTDNNVQELVVRHKACLTIYAQKRAEWDIRLAA